VGEVHQKMEETEDTTIVIWYISKYMVNITTTLYTNYTISGWWFGIFG
jgi:hypothetical protein